MKKKLKISIAACCLAVLIVIPILYKKLLPSSAPVIEPIIKLTTHEKEGEGYSLTVNAPKQTATPIEKKGVEDKKPNTTASKNDGTASKYSFDPQKMADLKKFKNQTDARIPPILNDENVQKPTEEQLDNPDLYQQYEMDQNNKQYAAFIKAAAKKVTMLQKQVDLAEKKGGVSKEEIAMAKEKIARLKAASKQAQDRINQDAPETIQFRQ
jgi:hypothetical protein